MLITSHSRRSVLAALKGVVVAFALAACQTTTEDNANRLTAEQVRSTFIDREWSNGSGTFMQGNRLRLFGIPDWGVM